jgi:hypothetical protein
MALHYVPLSRRFRAGGGVTPQRGTGGTMTSLIVWTLAPAG